MFVWPQFNPIKEMQGSPEWKAGCRAEPQGQAIVGGEGVTDRGVLPHQIVYGRAAMWIATTEAVSL